MSPLRGRSFQPVGLRLLWCRSVCGGGFPPRCISSGVATARTTPSATVPWNCMTTRTALATGIAFHLFMGFPSYGVGILSDGLGHITASPEPWIIPVRHKSMIHGQLFLYSRFLWHAELDGLQCLLQFCHGVGGDLRELSRPFHSDRTPPRAESSTSVCAVDVLCTQQKMRATLTEACLGLSK